MASLEQIRKIAKIEPSPQDAGLTLTIKITAYKKGYIYVHHPDHRTVEYPCHSTGDDGKPEGEWLKAGHITLELLEELQRQLKAQNKPEQA